MEKIHHALVPEGEYALRLLITDMKCTGISPSPPSLDRIPVVACGEPHPTYWSSEARHVDCPACLSESKGQK